MGAYTEVRVCRIYLSFSFGGFSAPPIIWYIKSIEELSSFQSEKNLQSQMIQFQYFLSFWQTSVVSDFLTCTYLIWSSITMRESSRQQSLECTWYLSITARMSFPFSIVAHSRYLTLWFLSLSFIVNKSQIFLLREGHKVVNQINTKKYNPYVRYNGSRPAHLHLITSIFVLNSGSFWAVLYPQ